MQDAGFCALQKRRGRDLFPRRAPGHRLRSRGDPGFASERRARATQTAAEFLVGFAGDQPPQRILDDGALANALAICDEPEALGEMPLDRVRDGPNAGSAFRVRVWRRRRDIAVLARAQGSPQLFRMHKNLQLSRLDGALRLASLTTTARMLSTNPYSMR